MKIVNVDWDATEEDKAACKLPGTVLIPKEIAEEDIAEHLSDTYGFCVNGYVVNSGNFALFQDLTDIKDSVQIESDDTNGGDICSYEEGKYVVTIEARGAVKIWWNTTTNDLNNGDGEYYIYWSEFPEELKNLIRNTGTADRRWTLDPRVYVSENNWFEIFLWKRDGEGNLEFIVSNCIDVEESTPSQLAEECISYLKECLETAV